MLASFPLPHTIFPPFCSQHTGVLLMPAALRRWSAATESTWPSALRFQLYFLPTTVWTLQTPAQTRHLRSHRGHKWQVWTSQSRSGFRPPLDGTRGFGYRPLPVQAWGAPAGCRLTFTQRHWEQVTVWVMREIGARHKHSIPSSRYSWWKQPVHEPPRAASIFPPNYQHDAHIAHSTKCQRRVIVQRFITSELISHLSALICAAYCFPPCKCACKLHSITATLAACRWDAS